MDDFGDDTSFEADDPEEISLNESALTFLDDSVFTEASSFSSEKDSSFSLAVDQDGPVTSTPQKLRRSSRSKKSTDDDAASKSTPTKTSTNVAAEKKKGTRTKKSTNEDAANNNTFKAPKAPKTVKQVFAKCPRCRSDLKTAQTFQNHMQAHKWKDLASKIPNEKEIVIHCKESLLPIVQKLGTTGYAGAGGEAFRQYAQDFAKREDSEEWNCLLKKLSNIVIEGMTGVSIQKRPVTFIHSIRGYLIQHINASLNCTETHDDLIESLLRVKLCVVEIAHPFLFTVLRDLGNSALKHMCLSMSGRDPQAKDAPKKRSKDDFNHLRTKQVVHYISGSCMKGIVRHAYTHRNSKKLQRRKLCIINRFGAFGQSVPSDPTDSSYWTSVLNRKSLFFVGENKLPFFLHIASIIQNMEKPDGSLGHEVVMEKVSGDMIALSLWSEIIDTELDDEESFDLLVKVVRSLTNTYGRGTLLRRMNHRWKTGKGNKGTISVSHRAKLL